MDADLTDPAASDPDAADPVVSDAQLEAVPRVFPVEMPPTPRIDVARRGRQIATVAGRHFAPLAVRSALTRRIAPDAWARPLRRTFEDLGATFMKFGQLIGSAPGGVR